MELCASITIGIKKMGVICMKKLLVVGLSALLLAACGNEVDDVTQTEDEKAKAKTEETDASEETSKKEADKAKENDIWTYYEDAKWNDDFKGLKTEIQKVVVSDKAPGMDDNGEEITTSAVGVQFKIENTTEGKFVTYPDQATLVTSTGEQVEADMIYSEDIGGEIDKGVIKEGDVIFYLKRGNADKIEWVKLSWNGNTGGETDSDVEYKEWETELKLK